MERAKYLVLSSLTEQPVKRFAAKPPDQAAVVRTLAESAGGSPERYDQMSGQDDQMGVLGHPGSHTRAAVSPAAASSGAFTRFETHELIEASDTAASAERAQGIAYHPLAPGKHARCSPDYPGLTGTDIDPIHQDGLAVSWPRHCQDHRRGHAARAGPPTPARVVHKHRSPAARTVVTSGRSEPVRLPSPTTTARSPACRT
jgi:uncharacterized protein with GYD domain